jgi:hypothetical protein
MERESIQEITQKGVNVVQGFFAECVDRDREVLPTVLQDTGVWMAIGTHEVLVFFFLNEAEQLRVNDFKNKGIHPFPGFVIGEGERPSGERAVYNVTSPFRFYSGKKSCGGFAFSVTPMASFVVENHTHELKGLSDAMGPYRVDLAFGLGYGKQETWPKFEKRLSPLLTYARDVWKGADAKP